MSHSHTPPQGPNPYSRSDGEPEPARRDYGARQVGLVIGSIVAMVVFTIIIVSMVRNAQSDDPGDVESTCESTDDHLGGTDDGYFDDQTDDYGFGEETTESCW